MFNIKSRHQAFIFLTLASLFWGATGPIMKITLQEVPIFSLGFIRMFFASVILFSFVRKDLKISSQHIFMFFAAAFFGVNLNLTLFFNGLKLTDAINASFLTALVPILTMFAAHIFLKEKTSLKMTISAICAFAALLLIVGKPHNQFALLKMLGNFLLILATFSWVAHEIVSKKLTKLYKPTTIAFFTLAIGAICFFPLFLGETFTNPAWASSLSLAAKAGILYGIFFSSLAAYLLWQKGLSLLPTQEAASFFYLDPLTGTTLSILLLGEKLSYNLIFGGILIFIAVILAESHRKFYPIHRKI